MMNTSSHGKDPGSYPGEYPDGSDRYWVKLLQDALTHRIAENIRVTGIRLSPEVSRAIWSHFGPSLGYRAAGEAETFWGYPVVVDAAMADSAGFAIEADRTPWSECAS